MTAPTNMPDDVTPSHKVCVDCGMTGALSVADPSRCYNRVGCAARAARLSDNGNPCLVCGAKYLGPLCTVCRIAEGSAQIRAATCGTPDPARVATDKALSHARALAREGLDRAGNDPVAAFSVPNGAMIYALADTLNDTLDKNEALTAETAAREGWELEAVKQRERAERTEEYIEAILHCACFECHEVIQERQCPMCKEQCDEIVILIPRLRSLFKEAPDGG